VHLAVLTDSFYSVRHYDLKDTPVASPYPRYHHPFAGRLISVIGGAPSVKSIIITSSNLYYGKDAIWSPPAGAEIVYGTGAYSEELGIYLVGLVVYDPATGTYSNYLFSYDGATLTDLSGNLLGAPTVIALGDKFYIGYRGGKVQSYDGAAFADLTATFGFTTDVRAMAWTGAELLAADEATLKSYNPATGAVAEYSPPAPINVMVYNPVSGMVELIAGDGAYLYTFNPATGEFTDRTGLFPTTPFRSISVNPVDGCIAVAVGTNTIYECSSDYTAINDITGYFSPPDEPVKLLNYIYSYPSDYWKYLAMDIAFIEAGTISGTASEGHKDAVAGIVYIDKCFFVEVASGVYYSVSPAGVPDITADYGGRVYAVFLPARHGYYAIYWLSDAPDVVSIAVSYKSGVAVLVKCIAGSVTVPKPMSTPNVETDGTLTTVDGYDAVSLSEGQYALFYSQDAAPPAGAGKFGFADRYPKEVTAPEGVSVDIDFTALVGAGGAVKIALGYGQDISISLYRVVGRGPWYTDGVDDRATIGLFLCGRMLYRDPKCAYLPVCTPPSYFGPVYADDPDASAGTWRMFSRVKAPVMAIEAFDGWWGWGSMGWGIRLDYTTKPVEYSHVFLHKYDAANRRFEVLARVSSKSAVDHYSYGQAAATSPFSARDTKTEGAEGIADPSSADLWDGSSWTTVSLTSGSWDFYSGYFAYRVAIPAAAGNIYVFNKISKVYTSAGGVTGYKFAAARTKLHCLDLCVTDIEDRTISAGEVWGYEYFKVVGATEYTEEPSAPEVVANLTDHPTEILEYL